MAQSNIRQAEDYRDQIFVDLRSGGQVLGACRLASTRRLSREDLQTLRDQTQCDPSLITYEPHGWFLTSAHRLQSPYPLPRQQGQVIWVTLEQEKKTEASLAASSSHPAGPGSSTGEDLRKHSIDSETF